jgi:CRP/FNR family transcriptional regulator
MKEAIDTFIHSLISLCPKLTESELEYIRSGISITTLQSKEYYVHANEVQKHIGFVSQGLIRCYYLDKYGKDITVRFIKEQHYATHYSAFISRAKHIGKPDL